MPALDASTPDPATLVVSGDWACAYCNPEALASVAVQLHGSVDEATRGVLVRLERLVDVDMLEATHLWILATHDLRERLFGRAGRIDW